MDGQDREKANEDHPPSQMARHGNPSDEAQDKTGEQQTTGGGAQDEGAGYDDSIGKYIYLPGLEELKKSELGKRIMAERAARRARDEHDRNEKHVHLLGLEELKKSELGKEIATHAKLSSAIQRQAIRMAQGSSYGKPDDLAQEPTSRPARRPIPAPRPPTPVGGPQAPESRKRDSSGAPVRVPSQAADLITSEEPDRPRKRRRLPWMPKDEGEEKQDRGREGKGRDARDGG